MRSAVQKEFSKDPRLRRRAAGPLRKVSWTAPVGGDFAKPGEEFKFTWASDAIGYFNPSLSLGQSVC